MTSDRGQLRGQLEAGLTPRSVGRGRVIELMRHG